MRVKKHAYSVPSRLIGHTLRVELYEAQLKVYLGREHLFDLRTRHPPDFSLTPI
jgi:hypothetical protein